MSLVTLFSRERNFIASDQLVFHSSEIKALTSLVDKAKELDDMLNHAEQEIVCAKEEACERGYRQGFEEGKSAAREKLTKALLVSQREIQAEKERMEDSAVELALSIVRKIGLDLGDATSISLLARKCMEELSPVEPVKLLVNPGSAAEVSKQLSSVKSCINGIQIEILEDATLDPSACVLTTSSGTIHAGLEDQLSIIQGSFQGWSDQRA